jgi:hypothetical protein
MAVFAAVLSNVGQTENLNGRQARRPESIQQRTLHSVLGMEIGSAIKMTQADFVRLYKACFAQVEAKFT